MDATKFWKVFKHEYLRHVLDRKFIMALLSVPLFIGFTVLVSMATIWFESDSTPIGYVDISGWLSNPIEYEQEGGIFDKIAEIIPYQDEQSAQDALSKGMIQGYYLFPVDFQDTREVILTAPDNPSDNAREAFYNFVQLNILKDQSEPVRERLITGSEMVIHSLESDRNVSENDWVNLVLPIFLGVVFIIVINMSGGYLMQAVVDEKENRTMEIIVTSVSSTELMAGKIVGNMCVGLTQILFWALIPVIAIVFFGQQIPLLDTIQLSNSYLWIALLTLLLAFIMVSALMAMVGAIVTDRREAQQVAGLFTLPLIVPMWLTAHIMQHPNSPFSVFISMFPLTAPIGLSMRAGFTDVPYWQTFTAIGLLLVFAIGAIWLAGRAFRIGMLRYGKRLSFKELFRKI